MLGLYMKYSLDQIRTANATALAASAKAQTAINLATPKQSSLPSTVNPQNGSPNGKRPSSKKENPRPVEQSQ
jgi:hypothetical protein